MQDGLPPQAEVFEAVMKATTADTNEYKFDAETLDSIFYRLLV